MKQQDVESLLNGELDKDIDRFEWEYVVGKKKLKKTKINLKLRDGEEAKVLMSKIFFSNNLPNPYFFGHEEMGEEDLFEKGIPHFTFLVDNEKWPEDKCVIHKLLSEIGVDDEKKDDDYLMSVELYTAYYSTKTLPAMNFNWERIKNGLGDVYKKDTSYRRGIYRIICAPDKGNPQNGYFLVLIRTKEKGQWTGKYLEYYLASSDSRTYQGIKYNIAQYKTPDVREIKEEVDARRPRNLLIFGAPGTGKSYWIKRTIEHMEAVQSQRVTFYDDYSYDRFVGAYMPDMSREVSKISGTIGQNSDGSDIELTSEGDRIVYRFTPGPFMTMAVDAWIDMWLGFEKRFVLVIEEINRANAASVFGDIFQLLDRDEDGKSEYGIKLSPAILGWMQEYARTRVKMYPGDEEDLADACDEISDNVERLCSDFRIPSNMYLWATMNSADQGVYPLDSAFKRRWSFMYRSTTENAGDTRKIKTYWRDSSGDISVCEILWDALRTAINDVMDKNDIEEDRFVGPWYFKDEEYKEIERFTDKVENRMDDDNIWDLPNPICEKLFHYLRQDVFRHDPSAIFKAEYMSLHKIRRAMCSEKVALNDILKLSDVDDSCIQYL